MSNRKQLITRILVANRGEIARRIIRSIHQLGLVAVAVYSEVDADSPHVHEADEALFIGASESAESYLHMDRLLSVALANRVDAIHPGYGFLSENAVFAQRVLDAGIIWIGPSPEAIALMGEKAQAKEQAKTAGVPVLEGLKISENSTAEERRLRIQEVGFPLLIKATYGGGGRGIRLVENIEDFEPALQTARSEALSAFGSAEVMVERYVNAARHIEIQVLADTQGNAVHLFERECSVQRRRQKVIEEAPSATLSPKTRLEMGQTALRLVSQIGYVSAGTIEFLVDSEERFYFLEMNTRIQVEHTVTEEITGLDLVAWQIKIARGEALDVAQQDLSICGHSIQARLYAEDPYRGYLPQSGPIVQFSLSEQDGLRYDHALHVWMEGSDGAPRKQEISTYYDPMIAKIIAYGQTREIAIARLSRALIKLRCFGITTNQAYLRQVLAHADFHSGEFDITWLERQSWKRPELSPTGVLIGAVLLAFGKQLQAGRLDSFCTRVSFLVRQRFVVCLGEERREYTAVIRPKISEDYRSVPNQFLVSIEGLTEGNLQLFPSENGNLRFVCNRSHQQCTYHISTDGLWVLYGGESLFFQEPTAFISSQQEENSLDIVAPMLGKVVAIGVALGQQIQKGDPICTIEAMKMEHQVCAKNDGIVEELFISTGDQVKAKQLLGRLAE